MINEYLMYFYVYKHGIHVSFILTKRFWNIFNERAIVWHCQTTQYGKKGEWKETAKEKCENIMNKKLHVKNRRKAINKIALRIELVKFISRRQRCR